MVPGRRGKSADVLRSALARELLSAPLIATLATRSADGTVHLVPMWFRWNGREVLIPTSSSTKKFRNLERDASASVMIDDSREGLDLRGLTIAGRVSITRAPASYRLNRQIHLRYVTAAQRDLDVVDAYLGSDDVTLRIRPEHAFTWNLRDTPAGRALRG